jgi:hypothetical protein
MLCLEVEDLAAATEWLEQQRVPMLVRDEGYLMIQDPDGIPIEIWPVMR